MSGESQEEHGKYRLHILAKLWLLSNMVQKLHEKILHHNVLVYFNIVQLFGSHPPSSWNLDLIKDVFLEFSISREKKDLSSSFSKNDNRDHNGTNNNGGASGTSRKKRARIGKRGAKNGGSSSGGGGGDGSGSGRGRGRGVDGTSGSGTGGGGGGGDDFFQN